MGFLPLCEISFWMRLENRAKMFCKSVCPLFVISNKIVIASTSRIPIAWRFFQKMISIEILMSYGIVKSCIYLRDMFEFIAFKPIALKVSQSHPYWFLLAVCWCGILMKKGEKSEDNLNNKVQYSHEIYLEVNNEIQNLL